ncbi:MAG: hypothetical protein K1X79_12130 [Oligoflexia bacterium]|nr:hypothetical protein [Oligoflexia bacterium]
MAGEVGGVGKGFFSETGELKSKQQVAKETEAPKESEASDKVEISSKSSEEKLSSALSAIGGKFRSAANEAATVINNDEQNADQAAKVVQEQLKAARDLKAALKEGNDEKTQVAREKLERATEKRDAVAKQIEESNQEVADKRAKNLNVANQQLGVVKTEAVKLERSEKRDVSTTKDVDNLIEDLKSDKQSISEQKERVRSERADLQAKVADGEERIAATEKRSLRNFEEADSKARDLAARITQNGSQALAANKLSEGVVQQLLT